MSQKNREALNPPWEVRERVGGGGIRRPKAGRELG
jgi:hypothetical protein